MNQGWCGWDWLTVQVIGPLAVRQWLGANVQCDMCMLSPRMQLANLPLCTCDQSSAGSQYMYQHRGTAMKIMTLTLTESLRLSATIAILSRVLT